MLTLKKHHQFSLSSLGLARPLAMSPVVNDDDDELTNSSNNDNWVLEQRPDSDELSRYWNRVEADIASDPTWIRFDDDEA